MERKEVSCLLAVVEVRFIGYLGFGLVTVRMIGYVHYIQFFRKSIEFAANGLRQQAKYISGEQCENNMASRTTRY